MLFLTTYIVIIIFVSNDNEKKLTFNEKMCQKIRFLCCKSSWRLAGSSNNYGKNVSHPQKKGK